MTTEQRTERAREIGRTNIATAYDQAHEYESEREALAAYLVNAVDTAREERVSPERAAEEFLRLLRMPGARDMFLAGRRDF